MIKIKKSLIISIGILLNSCATFNLQIKEGIDSEPLSTDKTILHSFYLIGDAGNSPLNKKSKALQLFEQDLENATAQSTAIFLGDNIYPKGFPKKNHKNREFALHQMKVQTEVVKNFKGKTIFIPGNHDWYSGLKGLKRQEKYIESKLGKNTFLPEDGCPIKKVKINKQIDLIIVDSHWYITNWDKHPTINNDCDIKTRAQFFDEFESLVKKARGKTTLIALHHPMFTKGPHGGFFSIKDHLFPIPVLGTLKNLLRKTSGIANVDQINKRYQELKNRVITLSQENDKVIFVSGHEHSMQYTEQDNLVQIVSGTGSNKTATRLVGGTEFAYGSEGYARLDVLDDGSSHIRFYDAIKKQVVFQKEVFPANKKYKTTINNDVFSKTVKASVYSQKEAYKGKLYKWLWGKRYREDYGVKVLAPTVNLDTLFGGLTPVRKGGGHQSKSLRLKDATGREYVMRAIRKNALQYLQAVAFKNQYIEGQYDDTVAEDLLLDVFAGSHPYAPFTIAELSDAIGVFHTNPVLYYIPKQTALGKYNLEFGDELYMIEERAASGHGEKQSFGYANEVISTHDMLQKINKNQKHIIDEKAYIRARLFDMLIGDWDRHEDQWRWAVFKEKDFTIYKPIPRDRDQAFSIMGDGFLLGVITEIIPTLRLMKKYKEDLKNPKWFNLEPYPLDVALINQSNKNTWDKEVQYISNNLTNEIIDEAFKAFPDEVNKETILEIKRKLIGRRKHLQEISDKYYAHINRYAVVKGTLKDDYFVIQRKPNGLTKISGYRIQKGEKRSLFHERVYSCDETKEVWVYGLDDKDTFEVIGEGDKLIPIRLIGGNSKDTYNIKNGKKIIVYDYKSKASEFLTDKGRKKLTDDYETNVYDYKKLKNSSNQFTPVIGFNPDDGIKIGFSDTFRKYGFERNPFSAQHKFSGAFFFATKGFDLNYKSEFANVIGRFNLGFNSRLTSPNYSINFFGFGNETINPNFLDDDRFNLNYNRVKLSTFSISPSIFRRGDMGSKLRMGVSYETIEVEQTNNRFINDFYNGIKVENRDSFIGAEVSYSFMNKDDEVFPTLGIETDLTVGYKNNLDSSKGYTYLKPSLAFDHKLTSNGKLVIATKLGSHLNLGNEFEFYQAANLGANNGLRGYRNQRFTGKRSYYQSTDLRMIAADIKTGLVPLSIGVYGGFDYGRVWLSNGTSEKWNNSYGAGIFINAAKMVIGNISLFSGNEGVRFAFRLGFGF